MIQRRPFTAGPAIDNGTEPLTEYRPEGGWTLRVGDTVTLRTVRVKGPTGRYRRLTGPIIAMHRTRTGRVCVDVRDPATRATRSAYAEAATKKRRQP